MEATITTPPIPDAIPDGWDRINFSWFCTRIFMEDRVLETVLTVRRFDTRECAATDLRSVLKTLGSCEEDHGDVAMARWFKDHAYTWARLDLDKIPVIQHVLFNHGMLITGIIGFVSGTDPKITLKHLLSNSENFSIVIKEE